MLLNRPDARNALSKALLDELTRHVQSISAEGGTGPTRALVLGSTSDAAFCAGADLKERAGMSRDEYVFFLFFFFSCFLLFLPDVERRHDEHRLTAIPCDRTYEFLGKLRGTFRDLANLPVPTISSIPSVALGGGLELGLCTHFRVFSSSTIVGLPETRLAIIPGAGGTYRLPELIGVTRARDMVLTGRRVSGAESYFIGLCDRLVEVLPEEEQKPGGMREKVLKESIKMAMDICEGGPIAISQALRAVHEFQRGEEAENDAYAKVMETEDRIEALRAFIEKRKPAFRGR